MGKDEYGELKGVGEIEQVVWSQRSGVGQQVRLELWCQVLHAAPPTPATVHAVFSTGITGEQSGRLAG